MSPCSNISEFTVQHVDCTSKILFVFASLLGCLVWVTLIMLSIHYFLSNSCLNLKALSASGLRALRYAREVEGVGQVVALDNDKGNFFNYRNTLLTLP